jgi:penicillin-insensitive murein endopeptidase
MLVVACAGPEPAARQVVRSTPRTETAIEPQPVQIMEEPAEPPAPPPDPVAALFALEGSASTSIGAPADGRLEGGVALPESGPGFRSNPRRPNSTAIYGTVELMQALLGAAAAVQETHPGTALTINDIGLEEGGPIAHHGSHRAGRDADVLFFLIDREGNPIDSVGAFLDTRGRGYDFKDLTTASDDVLVRLDLARTWRFVDALLTGPFADHVQRIFVAEHIRNLLLAHAERTRAPRAVRDRFAEITCQPSAPHDDHFHIRFFCTPEDMAAGCQDSSPIYGWRRRALRELDLEPVVYRPRSGRPRSPTVSASQARERAGRVHPRVQAWLTRREAWVNAPETDRAFCH